jgi:hypothetical protein
MTRHRNARGRLPKRPTPDNSDPGPLIGRLYDALVEVEALAITADEAVTMVPPSPFGQAPAAPGPAVHGGRQDLRPAQRGAGAGRGVGVPARGPLAA